MIAVRVALALALGVSGAVHLDLAGSYDAVGEQLTVGALFRAQGAAALLTAAWVLAQRHAAAPLVAALLVGVLSAVAVVLSVYVRLPAVGPLPELYEPVWYLEKSASAVAAAVAGVLAAVLLGRRRPNPVP